MMRVFQRAGHQLSVKTSAGIEEVTMLFPEHVPEQLLAPGMRAGSVAAPLAGCGACLPAPAGPDWPAGMDMPSPKSTLGRLRRAKSR